jgi:putative transposase
MPWKEVNMMDQRTEFALRALDKSQSFRRLCREYGISSKTGYKWRERFRQRGLEGLRDLSRRPTRSPRELGERIVCEIVRLKEAHRAWGPKKIRAIYQRAHGAPVPSESSFKRVLDRAGLVEPRRVRPRHEAGRLFSGRRAQQPNEIWTADFKGHWYDKNRRRCEPLTVRDEFSRYLLELRAMPNAQTSTVRQSFEQLFERHGLPAAIRSDNGVPFASTRSVLGLSRLSAWWVVLGIDLERSRPGCPQDNPAHERLHLDVRLELQDPELELEQAGLEEWRHTFNYERPHEALEMRCPAELYKPSTRPYEGTPADLSYPTMESRKVSQCGTITWGKRQWVFISGALAGWSVGLEASSSQAGQWQVWFGRLLLGQIDEKTLRFKRTEPAADSDQKDQMATLSKGPQ